MNDSSAETDRPGLARRSGKSILDPRRGDMENDRSATKQRSLLAIAGSLLAEISLPKLAVRLVVLDPAARRPARPCAARP